MDRLINDDARIQEWMHARSRLPIQKEFRGIAREVNGNIVAAFGYDCFQDWGCQLHAVADPRGFNKTLLRIGFQVPYVQWGYDCLLGMIAASNVKSLKFAAHLGFTEVARVMNDSSTDGLVFWKMRRQDCRWLAPAERTK